MDSSSMQQNFGAIGDEPPVYSADITSTKEGTKVVNVAATVTSATTVTTMAISTSTPPASVPNRTTTPAYRVFQIPELAHSIAQYLRPIYISQLRLVSKALYAAYIPYLRVHLHRNSTASWTTFPLLKEGDRNSKKAFSSNVIETNDGKTPTKEQSTPTAAATNTESESETKESTTSGATKPTTKSEKVNGKNGSSAARIYGDLVHDITADSMDNFESLLPILRDCSNLSTLTITRWSRDLPIFRQVLSMAPKLENLSVSFYNTVDLNVFLATLIIYADTYPSDEVKGETAATTKTATTPHSNNGKEKETSKSRVLGFGSLRSLDIKHRVPDINHIRWRVFKSALDKLPNLRQLSLTGIGFRGGKDIANPAITIAALTPASSINSNPAPLAPFTISTNNSHNISANIPPDHDNLGDDDDDDDDDEPRSLEDGNPASSRTYPQLQSLSLTFCECPVPTMLDLDRIFPNLTSLEMNKCRNTWLHVFERDPHNPTSHLGISSPSSSVSSLDSDIHNHNASTTTAKGAAAPRRVPFPLLTRLKLVDRYGGHEDLIYEIVKNRPGLVSLETYLISLNIDTLLPMANHCANENRFLTRFSLSPFWSNSSTRRDVERLFEFSFLSRVKHLYIQQELTEKIMFSSTLASLHIGAGFARESAIESDSVPTWNAILRRLPMLETLRIDRCIKDYSLFEGLGRSTSIENSGSDLQCNGAGETKESTSTPEIKESLETDSAISSSPLPPAPPTLGPNGSIPQQPTMVQDWTGERPYLQELQITFRVSCVVQTEDLDRELVQRFRFLERLYFSSSKKPADLDDRKASWRPGLVIEHRRYESK
ncbi:hypothetical protein BGX21_006552 [Mortierella sp. AD011]|nr:hypothetical protein BGX20_006614 [Mortierella sp. AD010]KAF9399262.1 hypothetical protein BGX21_006552 [Mortierella sp. AD011]